MGISARQSSDRTFKPRPGLIRSGQQDPPQMPEYLKQNSHRLMSGGCYSYEACVRKADTFDQNCVPPEKRKISVWSPVAFRIGKPKSPRIGPNGDFQTTPKPIDARIAELSTYFAPPAPVK